MENQHNSDQIVNWSENKNNEIWIDVPKEFSFKVNLSYLLRDKNECMYKIEDGVITRAIVVGKNRVLAEISAPNDRQILIKFVAGKHPKTMDEKIAIVDYIYDWFDLNTNLVPFYDMAKKDFLLKQTITKSYGLRIIGIPDLFEALCWAILGQQINLAFAYTLKRQFVEQYGNSIKYNGKTYWSFPTYKAIAKVKPEQMSAIQMTDRKREYIIGIARLMANGDLSKEKLLKLKDFKSIEKELTNIRGIGPWTANYVLMRCLRDPAAFPIADVGLMNSIKYLKGMDRKPTKEEIITLAIPWKGWEAYATFFLWRAKY